MDTLEIVVRMRPSLDHLGGVGEALLTRFLSTSIGVRYLHEIGFIEQELGDWFNVSPFGVVGETCADEGAGNELSVRRSTGIATRFVARTGS
jgi:hypothetical protein